MVILDKKHIIMIILIIQVTQMVNIVISDTCRHIRKRFRNEHIRNDVFKFVVKIKQQAV